MLLPINEHIIVKPLDDKTTKSGLVAKIDDGVILRGEVLEIGSKVDAVQKGDTVVFNPYAPESIVIDNEKYLILKQEDIMAIIK